MGEADGVPVGIDVGGSDLACHAPARRIMDRCYRRRRRPGRCLGSDEREPVAAKTCTVGAAPTDGRRAWSPRPSMHRRARFGERGRDGCPPDRARARRRMDGRGDHARGPRPSELGPLRQPWLVGLGGDRFALIATEEQHVRSRIARVDVVDGSNGPSIVVRDAVSLDTTIEDAGAADIDADGTPDLLLAQTDLASSDSSCRGSTDPGLSGRRPWCRRRRRERCARRLGVIGSFDASRGDDLAAYVMPVCTGETGASTSAVLRVYRLADGTTVASLPAVELDLPGIIAAPVRLDIDGDGRDELLARLEDGLNVIDPSDGWSQHTLAAGAALPLGPPPCISEPQVGRAGVQTQSSRKTLP